MVQDKVRRVRWVFVRLLLMAALLLCWFYSCAPPPPKAFLLPLPPATDLPPITLEPPLEPEVEVPAIIKGIGALPKKDIPSDYESMASLIVPGDGNWVDLGIDVEEGKRIFFLASGVLSLQKGNPTAVCGPDGYNLRTLQQPLPDQNIGALVGKVVMLLSTETDQETGKTIRHERVEYFFVGSKGEVAMPGAGRVYLGVNEQVVGDNEGAFEVTLYVLR